MIVGKKEKLIVPAKEVTNVGLKSFLPEVLPNINCEEDLGVIVTDQNSLVSVEDYALQNKPGSNSLAELGPSQHNEAELSSIDSYVYPSTWLSELSSDFHNNEIEINVSESSEI
ncbi:hypothetical protein FQA39_LY14983 [Lamprigera yunnana]|nr:hypothetical protein FQA39_LY14983 [Lamprigera yunnana]